MNMGQGVANRVFKGTNDAINSRLVSAMIGPQYAAYLMCRAGKEAGIKRANILDLMAKSAAGAANVAARTGASRQSKQLAMRLPGIR